MRRFVRLIIVVPERSSVSQPSQFSLSLSLYCLHPPFLPSSPRNSRSLSLSLSVSSSMYSKQLIVICQRFFQTVEINRCEKKRTRVARRTGREGREGNYEEGEKEIPSASPRCLLPFPPAYPLARMTNGSGGDAKYAFWFRDHSQLAFATLRLTCLPPHQS